MNSIDLIGHIGAFLSSITFIPQVYKAGKTRSVGDLSIYMIVIVLTSTLLWMIYGIVLVLWPVIIANSVIFLLSLTLLIMKLTFKATPALKDVEIH